MHAAANNVAEVNMSILVDPSEVCQKLHEQMRRDFGKWYRQIVHSDIHVLYIYIYVYVVVYRELHMCIYRYIYIYIYIYSSLYMQLLFLHWV